MEIPEETVCNQPNQRGKPPKITVGQTRAKQNHERSVSGYRQAHKPLSPSQIERSTFLAANKRKDQF